MDNKTGCGIVIIQEKPKYYPGFREPALLISFQKSDNSVSHNLCGQCHQIHTGQFAQDLNTSGFERIGYAVGEVKHQPYPAAGEYDCNAIPKTFCPVLNF